MSHYRITEKGSPAPPFKVSVVIPAFNEQDTIKPLTERLISVVSKYKDYEILFIDDGSNDKTLEIIEDLAARNNNIKFLSFSRNFGHQAALMAGLLYVDGDCIISLDADLQHPPELIDQLIEKWQAGYEVVYTIREDTEGISFLKRVISSAFYKCMNIISNINLEKGSADFRLLDKSVVEALRDVRESSIFLRGIISWVGFKQCSIKYKADSRFAGKSKYTFWKMFTFALNGITSFSVKPLHLATVLGSIISLFAFIYGMFALYMSIFTDKTISGWTSLILSVVFMGGVQLLMIGILGEYIGRVFIETKRRPNYIIRKKRL